MPSTTLTENAWKTTAAKFKVKDNGLQKALATYGKLYEDQHDELLDTLGEVKRLALILKKSKEAAANPTLTKYLGDLIAETDGELREVNKDKARAGNDAKTSPTAKRDQEDDDDEGDNEDEDEEEEGQYTELLAKSLQKLKSNKGLAFQFIVCDAKPQPAVMVAKKITPTLKEMLHQVTGSKRFLHPGSCRFDDGVFVFATEQPVTGLARKLQESIKFHTGKKLPIRVGTESAEEDESGAQPREAMAPPKLPKPELAKAPEVWEGTRDIIHNNIEALKKAIQAQLAGEADDFIEEINYDMEKMDMIVQRLDDRLSQSLAKAAAARDPAERKAELGNSKTILAGYIKYVKTEPLISHIDANPFGVKTNLKAVLTGSLTHMAQSIG